LRFFITSLDEEELNQVFQEKSIWEKMGFSNKKREKEIMELVKLKYP